MATAAGLAWAAVVLGAAWRHRPAPSRLRGLLPAAAPAQARSRSVTVAVGTLALRLLRRPAPAPEVAGRVGLAVLVALPVAVLLPAAAPAAGLAAWAVPGLRRRRAAARERAAVASSVPELVDLWALAVGAGLTVPLALSAVAGRGVGPAADGLRWAQQRVAMGARLADSLDALPARLGEPVRPLVAALVASDRYGAPLGDALDRLAGDLRHDRRRRAEEAARRVPVKLLFPLVLCILPAFALLTVVPLAASALGSLRL